MQTGGRHIRYKAHARSYAPLGFSKPNARLGSELIAEVDEKLKDVCGRAPRVHVDLREAAGDRRMHATVPA